MSREQNPVGSPHHRKILGQIPSISITRQNQQVRLFDVNCMQVKPGFRVGLAHQDQGSRHIKPFERCDILHATEVGYEIGRIRIFLFELIFKYLLHRFIQCRIQEFCQWSGIDLIAEDLIVQELPSRIFPSFPSSFRPIKNDIANVSKADIPKPGTLFIFWDVYHCWSFPKRVRRTRLRPGALPVVKKFLFFHEILAKVKCHWVFGMNKSHLCKNQVLLENTKIHN